MITAFIYMILFLYYTIFVPPFVHITIPWIDKAL